MSDWFSSLVRDYNPVYHGLRNSIGAKAIESLTGYNFIDAAYSDLNLAKTEAIASGVPILGGLINGINGAHQIEDYYRNTGFLPRYGPLQMGAASGIGRALTGAAALGSRDKGYPYDPRSGTRSIHDLYLYY